MIKPRGKKIRRIRITESRGENDKAKNSDEGFKRRLAKVQNPKSRNPNAESRKVRKNQNPKAEESERRSQIQKRRISTTKAEIRNPKRKSNESNPKNPNPKKSSLRPKFTTQSRKIQNNCQNKKPQSSSSLVRFVKKFKR